MARIWLAILTFAFVAIAGARTADAQVFKPRGKKGSSATAKKAPAEAPAKKPAARKTDAPNRVAAKPKKSRAADAARPSDLTPEDAPRKGKAAKAKAGKGRAKVDDEDDESSDADLGDDEVIITDDDD